MHGKRAHADIYIYVFKHKKLNMYIYMCVGKRNKLDVIILFGPPRLRGAPACLPWL